MAIEDLNVDSLAVAVAQRLLTLGTPIPYDSIRAATATDASGGVDHLQRFWQSPFGRQIAIIQIMLSPASSAGVYRIDGSPIGSETDGLFLPAGGGVIYLRSYDEVRSFRMRANAAGTITFSAQAYRFGWDQ